MFPCPPAVRRFADLPPLPQARPGHRTSPEQRRLHPQRNLWPHLRDQCSCPQCPVKEDCPANESYDNPPSEAPAPEALYQVYVELPYRTPRGFLLHQSSRQTHRTCFPKPLWRYSIYAPARPEEVLVPGTPCLQ